MRRPFLATGAVTGTLILASAIFMVDAIFTPPGYRRKTVLVGRLRPSPHAFDISAGAEMAGRPCYYESAHPRVQLFPKRGTASRMLAPPLQHTLNRAFVSSAAGSRGCPGEPGGGSGLKAFGGFNERTPGNQMRVFSCFA